MSGKSSRGSTAIILILIALLVSGVAWASITEVDEIARGDGRVIPATRTQTIQATEAGVVKEIAVKIGQVVTKGQLIVRLDDTSRASDLGEVQARVRALRTKVARLEAEATGVVDASFTCPETVSASAPQICENEQSLLDARRRNFLNTRAVLTQRHLQREKERDEALADIARLEGSLKISQRELALLSPMARRKLVAQTEVIRVQRQVNDFEGQLNVLRETVPRIEAAIDEARLQLDELELKTRQDALAEKTTLLSELSVLEEEERGESDRVARTDIRSPVDGIINTMEVNTIGSFVQPGSVVAEVVPTSEELLVEARISPRDVAFVVPGQEALVKITAFDFSIYGGLEGKVVNISSDSIVDQKTGEPYFEVRVKTETSQLTRNGKTYNVTPGMICSVDILTGRKTILHYLLKPFNKARQEALTER